VLLHGLGDSAHFFDNLLPALSTDYRVLAVDLPGHGPAARALSPEDAAPAAMARVVRAELERAGLRSPHLVGFSLGGWVALEMAAAGYGRSVLALAPPGLWKTPPAVSSRRARALRTTTLRVLDPVLGLLGRWPRLARLGIRGVVVHPDRVSAEQVVRSARDRRAAAGAEAARRAVFGSHFADGAAITVPVCVAYGDADRVVDSPSEHDALPPATRWVLVEDCGHAMSWDQPEACLALIAETAALAPA
jgi:pimeloyl-ACP methyl ester carboxylesterase